MPTTFGYVVGRPTSLQEIIEEDTKDEVIEEEKVNTSVLSDNPES